jgi:uncharacterized protein YqeY
MSLHQTIKSGIKEAMMAKDEVRLMVLRGLSAAFTNELVAKGRKPQEELSDEEALAVVSRAAKQRKDSIEQFRNAGREDLAVPEEAELKVVETFLPAQMSREEVDAAVAAKKAELGITDKADSGKLMQALMKDLKGKADGMMVKTAVEASFA